LGEYSYFNPQSSIVACNVFDVTTADFREHFLSAMIVGYLSSNIGSRDKDGFVSGEDILSEMLPRGFVEDQVNAAMRRLAARRLIETPYSHYRELQVDDSKAPTSFYFRATSIGIYHIRFWIGSFSFLDAVSTDTPVFDESARAEISRLAASFEIKERLRKTIVFRDYLESHWHLSNFDASYFDLPTILASYKGEFEMVARAAEKSTGQRKNWR
jgi:hypothetical protein